MSSEDRIGVVELAQSPNNLLSLRLVTALADAVESLAEDGRTRAVVMCAEGRHFCAGMDLARKPDTGEPAASTPVGSPLYAQAMRLFTAPLPMVAAVQGAAIGGGLGLALVADFRVVADDARLAANFTMLGIHHGFGMTVTLPRLVGQQRAAELLYTGARLDGKTAVEIGLADEAAPARDLRRRAADRARRIADSAPLAVRAVRATLRAALIAELPAAMQHEHQEQLRLARTHDAREGAVAARERRPPRFAGN